MWEEGGGAGCVGVGGGGRGVGWYVWRGLLCEEGG